MMERLMGNKVDVHLKFDETFSGILFDADENHIYLQNTVDTLITIPRENIKYYMSSAQVHQTSAIVQPPTPATTSTPTHEEPAPQQEAAGLNVYVDDEHIYVAAVPSRIDLSTCSEELLQYVWSIPTVQYAIEGKIQKTLTYDVGEVRIYTVQPNEAEGKNEAVENSFDMSSGATPIATPHQFLQTIGRQKK